MSKQVIETMLKKSGLLLSKHKIIFFSDRTLFQWNRILETSKKLIEILKQKKAKVIIITSKNIEKKYKKYFDSIIQINQSEDPEKMLKKVLKEAKRNNSSLKETILVANMPGFQKIAEETDKSFCFVKSPQILKDKSTEINSLSDILMYLE